MNSIFSVLFKYCRVHVFDSEMLMKYNFSRLRSFRLMNARLRIIVMNQDVSVLLNDQQQCCVF